MTTDADGWIEHDGKGMPVDGGTWVWVRFRDGVQVHFKSLASEWGWGEDGSGTITHYRIVDEAKPAATATKVTDDAMTVWDHYAAAALTGLLAAGFSRTIICDDAVELAIRARAFADAMMTERAK